jgi:hypothetical protein
MFHFSFNFKLSTWDMSIEFGPPTLQHLFLIQKSIEESNRRAYCALHNPISDQHCVAATDPDIGPVYVMSMFEKKESGSVLEMAWLTWTEDGEAQVCELRRAFWDGKDRKTRSNFEICVPHVDWSDCSVDVARGSLVTLLPHC